jgi:hypothetical protein
MEWIGHIKFTVFPEFGQFNAMQMNAFSKMPCTMKLTRCKTTGFDSIKTPEKGAEYQYTAKCFN